jgi:hypothetical protein
MILKRPNIFIWVTILVAWSFDFLFWDKVPGISFAIFVLITLGVGFLFARQQGLTPAKNTLWLLIPIAFFTLMTIVRLEPMTVFLNLAAVLMLMGILAHSFLGGGWWLYTFKDYVVRAFTLGTDVFFRQLHILSKQPKKEDSPEEGPKKTPVVLSVLRGVVIALPIVLFFTALLAGADPIFEQNVDDFLEFFDITGLDEQIIRGIYVLIIAYFLAGVYLHAFYKNHDGDITDEEKPWISRFLGFTEAAIILGSINLLFIAFVTVQFQYFFGGQANITLQGYTYAQYARRGFGELVIVALFSLVLFLGLSAISKRKIPKQRRVFSGLGIILVSLVIVILVSSFQRLRLYEFAYGFTRLRTYTHVYMIWLGLLLVSVVVLELTRRQRYFALAALVASLGFIVSLNLLNVDSFIARQNLIRARAGGTLDIAYLTTLSEDVVPALSDLYEEALQDGEYIEAIAGAIVCHAVNNQKYVYANHPSRNYTWRSFHLSRYLAQKDWSQRDRLNSDNFKVYYDDGVGKYSNSYVIVDGEKVKCLSWWETFLGFD